MKKKIIVLAPFIKTGGPRALHSVANHLYETGLDVSIFYYARGREYRGKPLYDDCIVPVEEVLKDDDNNILIIPEVATKLIEKYPRSKVIIWWLSVDYYLEKSTAYRTITRLKRGGYPYIFFPFAYIYFFYGKMRRNEGFRKIPINKMSPDILHVFNSNYVREFLKNNGIIDEQMLFLCSYIDGLGVKKDECISDKENIIVFNPTKSDSLYMKYVLNEIHKLDASIKCVPIRNMDHEQVLKLLKKSKLFIDLGFFPGPDRLPREAVSLFCNIITSNMGCAGNQDDFPFSNDYKYSTTRGNIRIIANKAVKMVYGYSDYIEDFNVYRNKVERQKQEFEIQFSKLVSIINDEQ